MTAPGRETRPWTPAGSVTVTGMLAASELVPGDVVASRYRIERVLGMGAMGVVFQARDLQLDIDVALKLLRPELASRPDSFDRFRQELLLARQVSSPHVVRIHDLVQHEQAWLISMDFVRGESLERLLGREGVLPVERALDITRQLAQGLMVAHAKGVVHRDLKPANVMIDEAGNALITDFGVARSMGATGLTASGMVVGTPAYLSPEQAQAMPPDGRSDLYALGLMLYEMLTGKLPFADGTPSEMLVQRIVQSPASVTTLKPDVSGWVAQLVARMLDVRLGGRFQSAEDIVLAINAQKVPRAPRSRRWQIAMLASASLMLAVVFVAWQWTPLTRSGAVTATVAPLDLALLPLRTATPDVSMQSLLDGVSRFINAALVEEPRLTISELTRVRHTLTRLNFDAEAAARNRAQVAAALNASALLEGTLRREGDRWMLRMTLGLPDQVEPQWTHQIEAMDETALIAGLPAMMSSLRQNLRLAAQTTPMVAPSPAALRLLADNGERALAADMPTVPESVHAMLWWNRLEYLEQSGDLSGAQVEAAQARTALAHAKGREAKRTLALAAVLLGETDRAIAELEALSANEADHEIRRLWARALADSGRADEALQALRHVINEDSSDFDAWFAMAKYAFLSGDSLAAVEEYLPQAQMLATRFKNRRALADVFNLLGLGYRSLGQPESALENLDRAAQLRRETGNARGEAASLQNLAMVRSTLGQFDAAREDLVRARALLLPLGDVAAMADLENDAGVLEEEQGEYRLALEAYRKSLSMRQSIGNQRAIGESLLNVGFGYYQVGEFDNALVHWERAQSLYSELEERWGQVRAQHSLGLALTARGEFAKAREQLQGSLQTAESAQMAEERAVSLLALAELDRIEGRFADANRDADSALKLFVERNSPRDIVEAKLLNIAISLDVGDWDAAESALKRLPLLSIENREQQAVHALRRGELSEQRGDYLAALEFAEVAVRDALAAHSLGTELFARLLKVRGLVGLNRTSAARSELEKTRAALSRYASVPLRLQLIETALALPSDTTAADYREAQAQLARLTAWGRAPRLHLLAADRLRDSNAEAAETAFRMAHESTERLLAQSSPDQKASLARLYARAIASKDDSP